MSWWGPEEGFRGIKERSEIRDIGVERDTRRSRACMYLLNTLGVILSTCHESGHLAAASPEAPLPEANAQGFRLTRLERNRDIVTASKAKIDWYQIRIPISIMID